MQSQKKVLLVDFEYAGNPEDYEEDANRLARPLANVPGLIWKIWMSNPGSNSFGCVYLFEDEKALTAFVDGPISMEIDQKPQFHNLKLRSFDIMLTPSLKTRAPLQLPKNAEQSG